MSQKTFTEDLFERQQIKNKGQLPKYYVHGCHPAIIDRATFQRVQEELARRSSLRRTSSKAKTEQGKHSGKYVLSGLLVCSECGNPYRRVTWMPTGEERYVWRCINRLEHGKRICKHFATLEELELHTAVTAAMTTLLERKAELIQAGYTDTGYDSRVQAITDTLETVDSAITAFDDGIVFQTVSSIKVVDKDWLSIRFKDGAELEQAVGHIGRKASA